jgi:hypothetical protein
MNHRMRHPRRNSSSRPKTFKSGLRHMISHS